MNYHDYYLLSFFDAKRSTSSAQLLHIFQGKRTPSMFYLAEINGWHHAFAQFKYITIEEIEAIIQRLLKKELIVSEDKGYVITQNGLDTMEEYFSEHYFPQLKRFTNLTIRTEFWARFQLFVQSFSEMSYQNKQYSPVIKHPQHQENVRLLFQQFPERREALLSKWIAEQTFLFEQLEVSRANVLAAQLTGHHKIGETKSQMQEQLEMENIEFLFYHQDTVEELLQIIQNNSDELVLLNAIVHQLHEETNYGLSSSTNLSYQLLQQGNDISSIANRRQLKENTVREHILEMAFVLKDFPISPFVPTSIYEKVVVGFEQHEDYSYREAKEDLIELEFMHYRLVELERIRLNE